MGSHVANFSVNYVIVLVVRQAVGKGPGLLLL